MPNKPTRSNRYKKRINQEAKAAFVANKNLIGNMNTEGQSFPDLLNKINEAATIRSYPTQAIGRKRNMFLKTLALDDDKFREWVQNRLYRLAYDNKRTISDFTPKDIAMGLQKWENMLRTQDPGFGKYNEQYRAYTNRFLQAATALLSNTPSGQGTKGVEPHDAPTLTPAGEPMAPGLIDYQSSGGNGQSTPPQPQAQPQAQAPNQEQPPVEEPIGPSQEEDTFMSSLQELEGTLELSDKKFLSHVENDLMEKGVDVLSANSAEIEQTMDEEFQQLLDSIPEDSEYAQHEQEVEELYGKYKERFLSLFEKMQGKLGSKLEKADEVSAIRTEKIKRDPSLFEAGIVINTAAMVGAPLETVGISELEVKRLQKDSTTYAATKRIATSLLSAYPQLGKATPYWMGRETSPDELSDDWSGNDGSSNTDIIFDFGEKRVKFKDDNFTGCAKESRSEDCVNQIRAVVKINDMTIVPKNTKDTKAIFNTVIDYFKNRDYNFANVSLLYQRLLAEGIQPEEARNMAQTIVDQIQQLRSDFESIAYSSEFKKDIKTYLKDLSVKLQQLVTTLPGFKKEFIYSALSGCGKFKEGSKREANFILSADETGDRIIIKQLTRELSSQISEQIQMSMNIVPIKSGSKDPLLKKYMNVGMSKDQAEQKLLEDYPYRLFRFVEVLKNAIATSMMMSPNMAGTVLPESSVLYSFMRNMRSLREEEEINQMDSELQLDPEAEAYVTAATEYAFSSFTNIITFFGVEFGEVASTNFNLYNLFHEDQQTDMIGVINNRVDMNNEIGNQVEQNRVDNGIHNKWFEYKQKERPIE